MLSLHEFIKILEDYTFAGNNAYNYMLALGIFLASYILLYIFRSIILGYLKSLSKKTKNNLDDLLVSIFTDVGKWAYPAFALFFGLRYLVLPASADKAVSVVFILILAMETLKALRKVFDFYVEKHLEKYEEEREKQGTRSVMNIVWVIGVVIFWLSVVLVIIANLGFNVTSLVASLGVGGIAVALAVQNILSDLLSSFSIYLDKPFTVGDYIVVGTDKGVVEKIGLKTTRLRSLTGEELIISNKELTSARINNFKRMERRRDDFKIGVVYGTPKEKLEKIPQIIKHIVDQVDELDFLRCRFIELADFSLIFSVVYFVETPDFEVFLDAKERVLLSIYDSFLKDGIEFAYPTQEVILKK
ncbi:MAG: mechanosensitive ion channel family protein [bacterium]